LPIMVIDSARIRDVESRMDLSAMRFVKVAIQTNTWVERFNVQGSGLMNPNRLNPKELRLHRGGK
jgi:hypothetical protein